MNLSVPQATHASIEKDRQTFLLTGLFCAYTSSAVVVSPELFMRNLGVFSLQFLPAGFLLCAIGLLCMLAIRRPASTSSYLGELLKARAFNLALIAPGVCIFMAAFWTLKYHIPKLVPFFADPFLASLDAFMHFGDPWTWTHAVMPSELLPALLVVYFPAWIIMLFGGIVIAAIHHDHQLRFRYFMAFALTYVVVGNVLATALSSVGPIFYDKFIDGGRFELLITALKDNPSSGYVFLFAERLYAAYRSGAEDIFAGISAMPSVHVAVATLNALFLSTMGKWAGRAGWAFVGLISFGSVYLGWHYALDGYVSIAAVILIWRFAGRVAPRETIDV